MATDDPKTRGQPPHVRAWRDVLNFHWPPDPQAIPRRDEPIEVRARVVFEQDGECWLEGKAERWDATHVHVFIPNEKRLSGNGVWLKPEDVYRRMPEPPK